MAKAKIIGDKESFQALERISKYQGRFESAWSSHNMSEKDELEKIFQGNREVFRNVNSTSKAKTKLANNVYNIAYEILESKVDNVVPLPEVKSKFRGWNDQAKMVENYIKHLIDESDLDSITDSNERTTYVQGYSIIETIWNPDKKHHLRLGEIEFRKVHPKQFIPQPEVYSIEDMDYFFIAMPVSREYLEKRYGVKLEDATEKYPSLNNINSKNGSKSNQSKILTEITCYYKDEDGDVGRYVYVNDTELEDLEKFYYRRGKVCGSCGEPMNATDELCTSCGGKPIDQIQEFEITTEDMKLEPIVYEKTVKNIVIDDNGKKTINEEVEEVIEERIVPKGTKIPYFAPTTYPVSIRINTPKEFCFGGFSDISVIMDQQDSIKKVSSKMEETMLKSGSIVTVPDGINAKINNESFQIIKGKVQLISKIEVKNLKADISQDTEFIEFQKRNAKDQIGVTDSFQGQADTTAQSGRAKLAQIQQTEGRLASSHLNKYIAYRRMFWSCFELMLAMYDETRPFIMTAPDGNDDWGEFNKYEFLMQDKAGEWFYNTDFIISATQGNQLPSDKLWIFEQSIAMASAGIIDKKQLFQILESLNYPQASHILKQFKDQDESNELQDVMLILEMLKSMPPEEMQAFLDMPPEQQLDAIGDITNIENEM